MDPYLATIMAFGFGWTPRGWAPCNGQLAAISQNSALFSLLGTTYGGDGRTTFALPDLRGRAPIHQGQGPGLTYREMGEADGTETNTLTADQGPSHTHSAQAAVTVKIPCTDAEGDKGTPSGHVVAAAPRSGRGFERTPFSEAAGVDQFLLAPQASGAVTVDPAGGSQPVNNVQPSLVLNYCIAMQGVYPSRD